MGISVFKSVCFFLNCPYVKKLWMNGNVRILESILGFTVYSYAGI